jgi:hypothetical protein
MPYYKNGAVKKLISRMEQVNSPGLQLDLAVLKVKNNVSVPSSTWARFCENENDRMELYTRLRDIDKLSLFPEVEYSDLVRSLYAMENGINLYKDSLLFVKKEKVIIGKDTGYLHFFKSKEIEEKDDDWEYGYIGLLDDDNQVIPEEVKYYEDRVRFNKFEDEDLQLKMARRELEMQDRKRYRVSDEKEFEELKNTRRRYYY